MINDKILLTIQEELTECKNLLMSDKNGPLYRLAQTILKLTADPDYHFNEDNVIVDVVEDLGDTATDFGRLSQSITTTLDTSGQWGTYLIPINDGKIKIVNPITWTPNAIEIEVKGNTAYKYVVGEGFKEI